MKSRGTQRRQQLGIAEICSEEGAIDGGKEQSLKRVDNKAPIMTGRRRGDGAEGSTRGFSFFLRRLFVDENQQVCSNGVLWCWDTAARLESNFLFDADLSR